MSLLRWWCTFGRGVKREGDEEDDNNNNNDDDDDLMLYNLASNGFYA